jgi:hypothetical protein
MNQQRKTFASSKNGFVGEQQLAMASHLSLESKTKKRQKAMLQLKSFARFDTTVDDFVEVRWTKPSKQTNDNAASDLPSRAEAVTGGLTGDSDMTTSLGAAKDRT